ncbi:MAG: hypothetical protein UU75_C0007G0041 [Candidatus Uhrbacteria bacterium GW2011_GWB1_41_7]|uniref:Uncharacterized protein n=1 Tax=Candidatus Uhrbacteria bacterium GW2011_GWC1_41_20 TaxID=1618983 RepID=A0A0G0VED9_9BACT|nr:MAG: hypothetical protein UU50_C0009G0041 [Candidatus Uhrbacteria bacterium GW2011_GWC1_41_20]KKS18179.1 MAG: hypothetical protein UU75_C0007G0041 [Candidatus Uhrbacteria bacterium GW2011_GWB1_41_7]
MHSSTPRVNARSLGMTAYGIQIYKKPSKANTFTLAEVRLLPPAGATAAELRLEAEAQLEAGPELGALLALREHRPKGRGDAEGKQGEDLVLTQPLRLDEDPRLRSEAPAVVVGVTRLSEEGRLAHQPEADGGLSGPTDQAEARPVPVGTTEAAGDPVDPAVEEKAGRSRLHHDPAVEPTPGAEALDAQVGHAVVPDRHAVDAHQQAGLGLSLLGAHVGLELVHPLLQAGEAFADVGEGVLDRRDAEHRGVEVGLGDLALEGGLGSVDAHLQIVDVHLDLLGRGHPDRAHARVQVRDLRLQGACAPLECQDVLAVEGGTGVHGSGAAGVGRGPDDGRGLGPRRVGGGHKAHGHEDQGHQDTNHRAVAHGVSYLALLGPVGVGLVFG